MVDAAPAWMSTSLAFHRFYNPRSIHRGSLTDSDRQGERPHDGETLLSSTPPHPTISQSRRQAHVGWVSPTLGWKWSMQMKWLHASNSSSRKQKTNYKKAQKEAYGLMRARLKQKNRHFTVTWLRNSHISKPPKGQKCNDDSMHGLLLLLHCKNSPLL